MSKQHCTCARSKCLKLYCVCFRASRSCGPSCKCTECGNSDAGKVSGGALTGVALLLRNRQRYGNTSTNRKTSCKCRKTNCLRRYCECFAANAACGDLCKCNNDEQQCRNPHNGPSVPPMPVPLVAQTRTASASSIVKKERTQPPAVNDTNTVTKASSKDSQKDKFFEHLRDVMDSSGPRRSRRVMSSSEPSSTTSVPKAAEKTKKDEKQGSKRKSPKVTKKGKRAKQQQPKFVLAGLISTEEEADAADEFGIMMDAVADENDDVFLANYVKSEWHCQDEYDVSIDEYEQKLMTDMDLLPAGLDTAALFKPIGKDIVKSDSPNSVIPIINSGKL